LLEAWFAGTSALHPKWCVPGGGLAGRFQCLAVNLEAEVEGLDRFLLRGPFVKVKVMIVIFHFFVDLFVISLET
jgi:hypothetical protein